MRRRKFLRGLMAVVFWLAVWQFAAWRLSLSVQWSELLLPYPTSVARRLVELMTGGEFWLTALASLGRIGAQKQKTIALFAPSPHPAAELMQLRKPKPLGIVDDHDRRV